MIYEDPNYDNMTTDDIRDWVELRASKISFFFNPGLAETGQTYICRSFFYAGLVFCIYVTFWFYLYFRDLSILEQIKIVLNLKRFQVLF